MNKNDPAYNPQWDSYLYQVDTTMQSLVVKLKAGMKPTVKKRMNGKPNPDIDPLPSGT